MTRYAFYQPQYSYQCSKYGPVKFSLPNFERLFIAERRNHQRVPKSFEVIQALGLDHTSHISSHVSFLKHGNVQPRALKKKECIPLSRIEGSAPGNSVEVVHSYGRGYVQPNIRIKLNGQETTGTLAVKGAGVEGWATKNKHWIVQEHQKRGVIHGKVLKKNFVDDLFGEFWAKKAGICCPVTVYLAKRGQGYQVGRLWRCPYRVWELTSGPFRFGPWVSQAFVMMHWGVELRFAVKYRDLILARARYCIRKAAIDSDGEGYFDSLENILIRNVASLAASEYQLAPFTFHLANIGYSGETTGFDRIRGPYWKSGPFRLGVLGGLIENWAAISWLRSIMGLDSLSFSEFFNRFQEQLRDLGADRRIRRLFNSGRTVSKVFSGVEMEGSEASLFPMPFAVRNEGDIETFLAACETFFEGLLKAFSGEIEGVSDLKGWSSRVDFNQCESVRVSQWMAGDILGPKRTEFLQRVRAQRRLEAIW